MKAEFIGYTEIDKPAQFRVAAQTKNIFGVGEVVTAYKFFDVKNGDDFYVGEYYDIEIIEGYAMEVVK